MMKTCVIACFLTILLFAAVDARGKHEVPRLSQPVSDDFPTNFTIGVLYVYNIQYQAQITPILFTFSAQAEVQVPDSAGRNLLFAISGEIGIDPWVVGFTGTQNGTYSPFPTKDLQLSFLSVSYNSTTGAGSITGGDSAFGSWTVEVDLDFVHLSQPAIGFVVTDAKPSLNGMPGVPDHAFDAADSLMNVGLVISSYDGQFKFISGVVVDVHTGCNLFAASVFDGVTIRYTGMVHFAGGFSVVLTATAENFVLGDGIAVSSAVITAQYPAQPFFSMTVQATWAGLAFSLQGNIGTNDIQFTGQAPGPWTINHGSTPVVVSQMLLTFDHTLSPAATTGELRGAVQWGSFPNIEGIMKYPADPQALGCFSLTVIVGTPSSGPSTLDGVVAQAVGTSQASAGFPSDAGELFGNTLQSVTFSVYPDCGALYVDAELSTTTFGTVNMAFAMFEYAPISSVLATFAQGLPDDPPVPIGAGSSYTVGAREALQSSADAFATITPPILVPKAYIENQAVGKAMATVSGTAAAMRQQLLVQLTEHAVQVDALTLLGNIGTALQSESWKAPDSYANSTWEWMASLTMTGAHWPLSEPQGLYLTAGSFALASASFQMTVGDASVVAQQGFNFVVDLDVSQSTLPALNDFKSVDSCVDKAFEVSGYIGNAQNGWFLQGALTDGCVSLGPNLQLSATSLRVQSAAPQVSFTTVVTLPQTQDLTFQMTGTFADSSGAVTVQLSGNSQSVYQTHVGVDPLEIDNVNLQLSVSMGAGAGAFSAQMSGAVTIDDQTEVAASSSFDSSAKALSFSLTIHEDKPVLLFNLLKLLIGQQAFDNIPMPQSGKDKLMGVYLVQGTMALSTQPPALSGGLQVLAFYKLLVSASLSFNDGKFAFGFSVQPESGLLDPIKLSDILPNITIVDEFRMRTPVIVVADSPASITIPGIQASYNVKTGFNFAAYLALDNTTARSARLTDWLGNNSVMIQGVIDPAGADFELQAQAALDRVPIVAGLDLTDAGFFISVQALKVDVGFDAQANLVLSHDAPSPANTLIVAVSFEIGTAGASFHASITGPWVSPFGVRGVTLTAGTVDLALTPDFLGLGSFGISGTLQVGNVQGSATFIADGLVLAETVLAASLSSVSLERDILTAICGKTPTGMFGDAQMQTVAFSVNPTLHTVQSYPPGITVAATNFVVGGITLQLVSFEVDPVLGVRIQIDAASSQTPSVSLGANGLIPLNSWSMDIDLLLSASMGVRVQGALDLLSVQCAATVDIDITHFQLAVNFSSSALDVVLAGSVGSGSDPFHVVDLSVSGEVDLHGYLSQRLLYYAQQTQDQKGPEIKGIQDKIASLQADIANLQSEIAQRSQNDTEAKQKAEALVQQWEQAVSDAKTKVDGLNQQIADAQQKYDQCGKHDYACQAKYKAEILSLQAALATANAALDAANAALQAAQEALAKLPDPDTDPQVLAWKAEVVGDQALIATLQATLSADLALTDLCSKVLQAGAAALQPKTVTFSSTSYVGVKGGSPGNAEIVGSFLGKQIDINVGMILTNVEQFVSDTWQVLQKMA